MDKFTSVYEMAMAEAKALTLAREKLQGHLDQVERLIQVSITINAHLETANRALQYASQLRAMNSAASHADRLLQQLDDKDED